MSRVKILAGHKRNGRNLTELPHDAHPHERWHLELHSSERAPPQAWRSPSAPSA